MPRIPYARPEDMTESVRAVIAKAPINVMKMLAVASPAVFEGYNKLAAGLFAADIPADLRETAILRVGYMAKATYETNGHEGMARKAGLDDGHLAAIRHGGEHPGTLSPAQQAVLDFTDDIVLRVRASDASLAAVRSHLGDRGTLDLIMLIGLYMIVCRVLETTGVEPDPIPPSQMKIELPK